MNKIKGDASDTDAVKLLKSKSAATNMKIIVNSAGRVKGAEPGTLVRYKDKLYIVGGLGYLKEYTGQAVRNSVPIEAIDNGK